MVKVALVHDWLVTCRGGEKVLEALLPLFPSAPIYTLFHNLEKMPPSIRSREVISPFGFNLLRPLRKVMLPLLPAAIESIPLFDYDLIVSTSSCIAKGALPGPSAKHLCYIHSPMRYVWDQRSEYIDRLPPIPFLKSTIHVLSKSLRQWDVVSSQRVDRFIANSRFVRERVRRFYGRDSEVVYPPVDVERFAAGVQAPSVRDYYLVAGAAVSYKRFDLAVAACQKLGRKLVVAGDGPEWNALRRQAKGTVEFVRNPDDQTWTQLMRGAKALLFPGVEDFGITGVEAIASGTPVIALKAGGALDFVSPGQSGVFFDIPESDALVAAIKSFEGGFQLDHQAMLSHARKFSVESFQAAIRRQVEELMAGAERQ
jgi:glycosyltransferase involved in cell wall biosynthesis